VTGEGAAVVEWCTFSVGERVMVRLSPECQFHGLRDYPDSMASLTDGQVGVIIEPPGRYKAIEQESPWREHPYLVKFDRPRASCSARFPPLVSARFAAQELEPVEPLATPPEAGAQGEG
jgi:hypothetical protein